MDRSGAQGAGLFALLALAAENGRGGESAMDLLRDAMPYTEGREREEIASLLALRDVARDIAGTPRRVYELKQTNLRAPMGSDDRLIGMLGVMRKYSGQREASVISALTTALEMKRRAESIASCGGAEGLSMLSGMMGSPLFSMLGAMGGSGSFGADGGDGGGLDLGMLASLMGMV